MALGFWLRCGLSSMPCGESTAPTSPTMRACSGSLQPVTFMGIHPCDLCLSGQNLVPEVISEAESDRPLGLVLPGSNQSLELPGETTHERHAHLPHENGLAVVVRGTDAQPEEPARAAQVACAPSYADPCPRRREQYRTR